MGLLRGMARTAVVAGTATSVSNRVSRRQSQRWAEEENQQAPASAAYSDDSIEQLERLGKLRDEGVLTQEEFESKKRQILG